MIIITYRADPVVSGTCSKEISPSEASVIATATVSFRR